MFSSLLKGSRHDFNTNVCGDCALSSCACRSGYDYSHRPVSKRPSFLSISSRASWNSIVSIKNWGKHDGYNSSQEASRTGLESWGKGGSRSSSSEFFEDSPSPTFNLRFLSRPASFLSPKHKSDTLTQSPDASPPPPPPLSAIEPRLNLAPPLRPASSDLTDHRRRALRAAGSHDRLTSQVLSQRVSNRSQTVGETRDLLHVSRDAHQSAAAPSPTYNSVNFHQCRKAAVLPETDYNHSPRRSSRQDGAGFVYNSPDSESAYRLAASEVYASHNAGRNRQQSLPSPPALTVPTRAHSSVSRTHPNEETTYGERIDSEPRRSSWISLSDSLYDSDDGFGTSRVVTSSSHETPCSEVSHFSITSYQSRVADSWSLAVQNSTSSLPSLLSFSQEQGDHDSQSTTLTEGNSDPTLVIGSDHEYDSSDDSDGPYDSDGGRWSRWGSEASPLGSHTNDRTFVRPHSPEAGQPADPDHGSSSDIEEVQLNMDDDSTASPASRPSATLEDHTVTDERRISWNHKKARRALHATLEIVSTEHSYLKGLRLLLSDDATSTPVPAILAHHARGLVRASEDFLRNIQALVELSEREESSSQDAEEEGDEHISVALVARAFTDVQSTIGTVMVQWANIVGSFFVGPDDYLSGVPETQSIPEKLRRSLRPSPSHSHLQPLEHVTYLCPSKHGGHRRGSVASHPSEKDETKSAVATVGGKSRAKFSMRDLAILPIQRVVRYVLMFNSLYSVTSHSSPSRSIVKEALEAAQDIALRCDQAQENAAFSLN